jgi:hypothetical protein
METEKETKNTKLRLEEISRNIKPHNLEFYENYKRNEFATIWDDKKTLARSPIDANFYDVKIRSSRQQVNPGSYQRSLLPTTSSIYGYHSLNNINNN